MSGNFSTLGFKIQGLKNQFGLLSLARQFSWRTFKAFGTASLRM
jgi:hypothetical protein